MSAARLVLCTVLHRRRGVWLGSARKAAIARGRGETGRRRAIHRTVDRSEAAATPTLQVIAANFVPSALRSRYWGVVSAALAVGSIAAYELTPPLIDSRGKLPPSTAFLKAIVLSTLPSFAQRRAGKTASTIITSAP